MPGQELAMLVALSLWNLAVVRGFLLDPPPVQRPVTALRNAQLDDRIPA